MKKINEKSQNKTYNREKYRAHIMVDGHLITLSFECEYYKYPGYYKSDSVPAVCDGQRIYSTDKELAMLEKTVKSILDSLDALSADIILEWKYQVAMSILHKTFEEAQAELSERQLDDEALREEIARKLQGKSAFNLKLLQDLFNETKEKIARAKENLAVIETEMQNLEQLRRDSSLARVVKQND